MEMKKQLRKSCWYCFVCLPLMCAICLILQVTSSWSAQTGKALIQNCFDNNGKPALSACRELFEADDNDLKVMKRLSDLLSTMERFDESLRILGHARQRYPANKRIAYKIKVTKSMEAEKLLFAEEDSKAEKVKRKKSQTSDKVSRLLCLRVKGTRGLDACKKAISVNPKDAELQQAFGDLLLAAGKESEAHKAYKFAENLKLPAPEPLPTSQPKPSPKKETVTLAQNNNTQTNTKTQPNSIAEKLRNLKSLYEQKLIDENDYQHRKTALMDQAFGKARADSSGSSKQKSSDPKDRRHYGNYHALVIGVQNYRYLDKLEMAKNDAIEVSKLLEKEYGFTVVQLEDPTRRQILMALGKMRRTLKKNDNLLIYYAGHGWLDRDADTGYWMPVDAASDNDIDWLSLNSVTSAARAISAKHLMIVADSCFSGKLTRGLHIEMKQADHLSKMASRRTRVVLTSGGLEPVLDAGGGKHSVFAAAFLDILRQNKEIIDGTTLFSRLRRNVMLKASQTPEYSDIRKAGHEGGDFLFVRRKPLKS